MFSTVIRYPDRKTLICHYSVAPFYPYVVDLEEIQVDPEAEHPVRLIETSFSPVCLFISAVLKCIYFTFMLPFILTLSRKSRSGIFIDKLTLYLYIST